MLRLYFQVFRINIFIDLRWMNVYHIYDSNHEAQQNSKVIFAI